MARKNALGLELTFHPSGRWMKRGKEFPAGVRYFGTGKSKTDRASYDTALAAYRQWRQEQQASKRDAETWQRVADVLNAVNGVRTPQQVAEAMASTKVDGKGLGEQGGDDVAIAIKAKYDRQQRPTITPQQVLETLAGTKVEGTAVGDYLAMRAGPPSAAPAPVEPPAAKGKTVGDILELFDQWNEQRNQQRHRNDTLRSQGREVREKRGQTISNERLASIRRYLDRWKLASGSQPWDGTERTFTAYLNAWKADADRRGMGDHDEAVKVAHQFTHWAYDGHHLDTLPRNMKNITQKYEVRAAAAVAIPIADLLKLWAAATDDMRAWIALGLNCGFYAKDVSDLEGKDIGPIHLDHWREKTINTAKVNVKYKLWDVTRKVIERSRTNTGANERVWLTRKGKPLVHTATASRTRGKSNNVTKQFRELCKAVGLVDEVPDDKQPGKTKLVARYDYTNVRDTGTTAVEQIDKSLSDLYDAHADPRQARLYVDKTMVETKPLDDLLDRLEQAFNLPLPPPKENKWKGKAKAKAKANAEVKAAAE